MSPRDNIALSWLSQKVDLSYDWYENLMISKKNIQSGLQN